jgi:probable F420-dependent oxidoreductase
MKVRVGFGLGTATTVDGPVYAEVVDTLERLGFDSLWLSERIGTSAPDPLVAMSFAAGRTTNLKFGMSVMVLPGRNPIVLAKELATLDRLSGGRLLPAFGLGIADTHEQQGFGVARNERAEIFDEAMAVLRAAWSPGAFTHHGTRFHYDELRVEPKPTRAHLDVWLGGIAPSELRRVARLADGWLPSFVTAADVRRGREAIQSIATEYGRTIPDDHYGVLVPYVLGEVPPLLAAAVTRRRPDLTDPAAIVATTWDALHRRLEEFVDVGATKFVIVPFAEPRGVDAWVTHLEAAAPLVQAVEALSS